MGQLQEHPLTELIREISATGLSGALRLERERVKIVLYFETGDIIFAASNLRLHRLSECLRRWRTVSEAQIAAAGEQSSDMRLAQTLFAAGAFDRKMIDDLFSRQSNEILCPALLWTEGSWSFDPRVRFTEETRIKLEVGQLLMDGARRLPPEFAAKRFRDTAEKISPAPASPEGISLQPAEAFVLSRVETPLSVDQLVALSGLPEADALRAVYTLALGGFLQRDKWPSAFTDEEIKRALAMKLSTAKASPAASGAAKSLTPEKTAQPSRARAAAGDEQSELDALFARLDQATNHYQVLDISRKAAPDEIKRAYFSLAKRFHPDRFHQNALVRARLEPVFARIAQAYEILKDRRTRATYDFKLDGD